MLGPCPGAVNNIVCVVNALIGGELPAAAAFFNVFYCYATKYFAAEGAGFVTKCAGGVKRTSRTIIWVIGSTHAASNKFWHQVIEGVFIYYALMIIAFCL